MSQNPKHWTKKEQEEINKQLAPVYRIVGVLTFFIGLGAILVGLWIDRVNKTQPIFLITSLVISVPLVLWLNSRLLRRALKKAAEDLTKNK